MTAASKENDSGHDSPTRNPGPLKDQKTPVPSDSKEIKRWETTREILMRIQEPRTSWKWISLGILFFILILGISIFLATRYIHRKEAVLKKVATPKIVLHIPAVNEKKIVIKRYRMKPFLLRIKGKQRGRDRFIFVRLDIEFLRKKIPPEISTRREILRTLVYKQLLRHFSNGKKNPDQEKHFREELIPALNTFFKGGGVYNVGFVEFTLNE